MVNRGGIIGFQLGRGDLKREKADLVERRSKPARVRESQAAMMLSLPERRLAETRARFPWGSSGSIPPPLWFLLNG